MQDLIATIDEAPRGESVAMTVVPGIDELPEAWYADDPAETGVVCMRHVLVETEADAERIVDELAAGADFATLAVERSIDPTAADTGGRARQRRQPVHPRCRRCSPVSTPASSPARWPPAKVSPSMPVESSFGWHVILHRPWDEIAESVARLHQPGDSGVFLFDGFAVTTDVVVDARFGTWDPIVSGVAPIG